MRLKEIKPGMVIHCKTEEERIALINHLEEQGGFIWKYTRNYPSEFPWASPLLIIDGDYNITQGSRMDLHENITEFSDLIIPELSAKEVLEAMKEICENVKGCTNCPLNGDCNPAAYLFNVEKIVDACTVWRMKHPKKEKKELETEWVDVVRIIKVHDNGKKECVHEVDLFVCSDDVAIPYHEIEESAERELKDYVANHKGNYFATIEHICRIKE